MTLTDFLIAGTLSLILGCGIAWAFLIAASTYVEAMTSCGAC